MDTHRFIGRMMWRINSHILLPHLWRTKKTLLNITAFKQSFEDTDVTKELKGLNFLQHSYFGSLQSANKVVDINKGKTKYLTGKVLYRWSRGKSRSFLPIKNFICVLINKLDFHGTNSSPILPICKQYSLLC